MTIRTLKMETFAENVRSGTHFDPMMEEGGWIQDITQKLDVEMEEAIIEVLAKANQPTSKDSFNFFVHKKVRSFHQILKEILVVS